MRQFFEDYWREMGLRRAWCWLRHDPAKFTRVRRNSTMGECPMCGERWIQWEE